MSLVWNVIVVLVLVAVAGLFASVVLRQRTVLGLVAGVAVIGVGVVIGAEIVSGWLALALTAVAVVLAVVGRFGETGHSRRRRVAS